MSMHSFPYSEFSYFVPESNAQELLPHAEDRSTTERTATGTPF